jgi:hypothetical protein
MCNKSQNLLFPHEQLVSEPFSLNIIAFLARVNNASFLALNVNIIKLSAFGAFGLLIKKFDTFELPKVKKVLPLHFYFNRFSKCLNSKIFPTSCAVSPFYQYFTTLFSSLFKKRDYASQIKYKLINFLKLFETF